MVNITDRSAGGKFLSFVGADDYSLGLETARFLLKTLGGKGNIVIIEGVKGSLTNVDRVRGFNDALKETPGAKLLASQPGNYQRLQALQVMENLMQSNSQIDGVLAANDAMAVGAIEALDGANRKAQVIGINGTKEAIDAIKSGKLLASGDYNGFAQGSLGTMMAIRSLRNQPIINEIVLEGDSPSKVQLAAALGISRQMLHGILTEKHGVTAEMAVKLGHVLGNGPGIWLRMQQAYDLWHAERNVDRSKLTVLHPPRAA